MFSSEFAYVEKKMETFEATPNLVHISRILDFPWYVLRIQGSCSFHSEERYCHWDVMQCSMTIAIQIVPRMRG
jgi:hypothetical protein